MNIETDSLMIETGIDFGGSFIKFVQMEDKVIKNYGAIPSNSINTPGQYINKFKESSRMSITGGRSQMIYEDNKTQEKLSVSREFDALGRGASYLTGLEKQIVVSVGTGTSFLYADGNEVRHITGSGLGAGILKSFCRYFDIALPDDIAWYNEEIDIRVRDIVGGDIGRVSADAAASHLGNLCKSNTEEEIVLGIFNMISKTLAVITEMVCKATNCFDAVFVGWLSQNDIFRHFVLQRKKELDAEFEPYFPKMAAYAGAIGALL